MIAAQRVRANPRISVNKLAEYLTSGPGRRRTILKDQKYPPTFQAARYADAEQAIVAYLREGRDAALLERAVASLRAPASSDWQAQSAALCIEALEAFREVDEDLDLDGLSLLTGPTDPPQLSFANVSVSVRPELVVTSRAGRVGMVKLYFAKGEKLRLDDRSGPYVAAVCNQFASQNLESLGASDHRLIFVVDVFGGRIFSAPRALARRLEDVTAACEEIAARWPTL